jgi:beta-lactamase regulating signal transducer with metallopeptidase domain
MLTSFFEKAYFLQSIGWAVANSFWQAAILWTLYQSATYFHKKLPALVKFQLSLSLIFISAIWFGFTALQNYIQLTASNITSSPHWIIQVELLNQILPFVAVIYFGILCFHIYQFVRQYLQLRFISKKGLLKAPADIRLFTATTALHLGIKKKVQVWFSSHVDVPSVTGFIKPIILLPVAVINHLSTDQVNAILLHELAHIKRNDFLLNLLQSLVALILFFNPFVTLLNAIAKKERENCCDDWVINFRYNQKEYARALLVLEEQRHQHLRLAVSATNDKKILLQRIKRLLAQHALQVNTSRFQKFQLLGLSVLIFLAICLLPSFSNKKSLQDEDEITAKPTALFIKNNPAIASSESEQIAPIIADKILAKAILPKPATSVKKHALKKQQIENDGDYEVLAMVNEEALQAKTGENEPILAVVSRKEKDSVLHSPVIVKIEEEQSGNKQSVTYYFKLKKDESGATDVKPLLFIKKYATTKVKKLAKPAVHKKRITT